MGIVYMRQLKLVVFLCVITFAVSCGQQKKYISYTVKKGETMRTIAKRLDMKTRDLLRLNPDVGRRPDANTVIIIPNKSLPKLKEETNTSGGGDTVKKDDTTIEITKDTVEVVAIEDLKKEFVIHKVKKGDTFYSLTRFYNVSENDLKQLNPELENGLKLDMILKIKPLGDEDAHQLYEDVIARETPIKLAMLLPFNAQKYDTLMPRDVFSKSRLANIVTDFYLGAELAIDSLRGQGVDIELSVYDTEKRNSKVGEIVRADGFEDNDIVIGPFYSDEARIVANRTRIPVVFPMYSTQQKSFSSSRLIKSAPDKSMYREELVNYLSKSYKGENIIVVSDSASVAQGIAYKFTRRLKENDSIQRNIPVLKPNKGYIAKERFDELLKPEQLNWIIVLSGKNDVIADVINSTVSLPEGVEVKVITTEKVRAYGKVDNNKLAQIGFTYVTDTYVDESSYTTQTFNAQYLKKNYALPSEYATKGFDITYDILMRLASGDDLKDTFKDGASYRIESKFDYSKKLFNTTDNKGLFIVQYNPDLSLTRLK